MAFWFALDLGGKRRFEQAKKDLVSLGVYESWEAFQSDQVRIPDEDNVLKHPVFATPDLHEKLLDGARKGLHRRDIFDPRVALKGTPKETDRLEEAWEIVSSERTKSLNLYLELLEAFERGQIDLNPQPFDSPLYQVVDVSHLVDFMAYHSLIDFRENHVERANQGLEALFVIARDMLEPRNFPGVTSVLEAFYAVDRASIIMGARATLGKIPKSSISQWRFLIADQRAISRQVCLVEPTRWNTLFEASPEEAFSSKSYAPVGFYYGVMGITLETYRLQIERLDQNTGLVQQSELVSPSDLENQPTFWPFTEQQEMTQMLVSGKILEALLMGLSEFTIRFALLEFHADHKRWPATLNELRPDYLGLPEKEFIA